MPDESLLVERLLKEAARREAALDPERWSSKLKVVMDQLMPMQRRLVLDEHKRIALLTPGRVGKTFTVRARLFRRALTQPNSLSLYIGLTRQKAEQEIWSGASGLIALCDKLGLKEPTVKFDRQRLLFTVPEFGSTIMCGGADDLKSVEVYRGGPGYDEVWIDEAKSHPKELLKTLIVDVLTPRINARYGVLGLCGTPGAILDSMFYEITRMGSEHSIPWDEPNPIGDLKWAMHRWALEMNTTKVPGTDKTLWQLALQEKASNGWTDQNASWMREYLGLWAADLTDFCYRFRPYTDDGAEFNVWTPKEPTSDNPFGLASTVKLSTGDTVIKWKFAIGMDLGSTDPCALEVFAFADQTRRIFHVHEWYRQTLDVDVLADALVTAIGLVQKYTDYPIAIVGDTAHMGATILEQIRTKTGHKVEPAKKADKLGFVALTNDDLVDGRLRVLKESALSKQMATLQWDESGKRENKAQRNDACDASIYARGAITRYISHADPVADPVMSPEQELLHGILGNGRATHRAQTPGVAAYQPGSTYLPK
jgi:hypothetical protein